MILGIDFDNTIVNYDWVFHQVALERKAIPPDIPVDKTAVRDYLRGVDEEDVWTEMQGYVYGARMDDASIFPGVLDCLETLLQRDIPFYVISHKTKHPYKGEWYDLHEAAKEWLRRYLFEPLGLSARLGENVFFNPTKQAKAECIASMKCTHFVDDLPEFLADVNFPSMVRSILFAPNGQPEKLSVDHCFASWNDISEFLCGE
jgi:hypothetical protein